MLRFASITQVWSEPRPTQWDAAAQTCFGLVGGRLTHPQHIFVLTRWAIFFCVKARNVSALKIELNESRLISELGLDKVSAALAKVQSACNTKTFVQAVYSGIIHYFGHKIRLLLAFVTGAI